MQIAQRWILARMRNEVFHSPAAMNARIRELLVDLNARVMRRYGKSRRDLFEQIERAALRPLPAERFEYADWTRGRVNLDYHLVIDGHFYSVPHRLVHHEVEGRLTATTVEILHGRKTVAVHARSHVQGAFTTIADHMPSSHRAHAEWTPSRILSWASKVGVATHDLCAAILKNRPHPEQGFRSCLGILRLAKRYGDTRLEAASARALRAGARSYRHVDSILKHGLDRVPVNDAPPSTTPITHENIRGRDHYN